MEYKDSRMKSDVVRIRDKIHKPYGFIRSICRDRKI